MTYEKLKEYLVNEAEYSEETVNNMDGWDLLDAWLSYNGIIGYTSDVISVVEAAFGADLDW